MPNPFSTLIAAGPHFRKDAPGPLFGPLERWISNPLRIAALREADEERFARGLDPRYEAEIERLRAVGLAPTIGCYYREPTPLAGSGPPQPPPTDDQLAAEARRLLEKWGPGTSAFSRPVTHPSSPLHARATPAAASNLAGRADRSPFSRARPSQTDRARATVPATDSPRRSTRASTPYRRDDPLFGTSSRPDRPSKLRRSVAGRLHKNKTPSSTPPPEPDDLLLIPLSLIEFADERERALAAHACAARTRAAPPRSTFRRAASSSVPCRIFNRVRQVIFAALLLALLVAAAAWFRDRQRAVRAKTYHATSIHTARPDPRATLRKLTTTNRSPSGPESAAQIVRDAFRRQLASPPDRPPISHRERAMLRPTAPGPQTAPTRSVTSPLHPKKRP